MFLLDIDLKARWFSFAKTGNLEGMKSLLFMGSHVINWQDERKLTALSYASQQGQDHVAQFLLDHNVDIKIKSGLFGQQAIHKAAYGGNLNIMKMLSEKHPDVLIEKNDNGWTPLMFATRNGQLEVCEWLVQGDRVDINDRDQDGWTALHLAASNNRIPIAELLIKSRAEHLTDISGKTPLDIAKEKGFVELSTLLESQFCDITKL